VRVDLKEWNEPSKAVINFSNIFCGVGNFNTDFPVYKTDEGYKTSFDI
jgi:hypothetical protein